MGARFRRRVWTGGKNLVLFIEMGLKLGVGWGSWGSELSRERME